MAYPATFSSVDGTTLVSDADHAGMHNAVETTVGTTAGTNVLKNFAAGDFPARINSSNVLKQALQGTINNSIFGTSSYWGGTVGTVVLGTSQITGGSIGVNVGTLNNMVMGTPTITGGQFAGSASLAAGTINNAVIGTPAVTGGTASKINIIGYISPAIATTVAAGGTATLDLQAGNEFRVTFGTGNATLVVSNGTDGQKFIVSLTQDATGTRTVTWFTTIKWPSNAAPTLTTTAAKRDSFGFIVTGSNTYDGFVIGQNL